MLFEISLVMNQPDLGKKIAELRKAKGLTQEALVEKCNLNVRTLQRIESGEVTPRSYTIKAIFTALEYSIYDSNEITLNEFRKSGFIISGRLEQLYKDVFHLFNLKTNTMKKISILSFFLLVIVTLSFNLKVHSQSNRLNPLEGTWELTSITTQAINSTDSANHSTVIKMDKYSTRYLEFKSDLNFETRTIHNDIYNGGVYQVLNDSSFITVHFGPNGKLGTVSNLYQFKIDNNTLHFMGFYLDRAPGLGEKFYEKKIIDERWVKLKDNKR